MDRGTEIDRFKTDINLARFAAGEFGYVLDQRKTSRQSWYMRHPQTGSKISIFQNAITRDWMFKSYSDPGDKGTIIDMVQRRTRENLGQVRKRCRPWLGSPSLSPRPIPADIPLTIEPTRSDVLEIRNVFDLRIRPLSDGRHPYLNDIRGLNAEDLAQPKFSGRIHRDTMHGNAVFVHRDRSGVTGWESRNHNFKGFSGAGYKSLWWAKGEGEIETLVYAESAIDAVSYALLHADANACYCSTAGQISADVQSELVASAMNKLPKGGQVIVAADNDQGGEIFTRNFADILATVGRDDLHFKQHAPPQRDGVTDWNDVWTDRQPEPTPHRPDEFDFTK